MAKLFLQRRLELTFLLNLVCGGDFLIVGSRQSCLRTLQTKDLEIWLKLDKITVFFKLIIKSIGVIVKLFCIYNTVIKQTESDCAMLG